MGQKLEGDVRSGWEGERRVRGLMGMIPQKNEVMQVRVRRMPRHVLEKCDRTGSSS